ncbi:MAG: PHP domain-containing protein [Candidatus Nanohaloarchaea archaeon]|nr:PHP domain-containing protein [Candidatus Nanohaloarchaea archaeon]
MADSKGFADLHLHTTASDGTDSVEERVSDASERGFDAIAVTDHDTINRSMEDRVEHRQGVEVICGSEIKAGLDGTKVEVLGYFLQPDDERLNELFDRIRRYREERMREMVRKVNAETDATISYEEVAAKADTSIGRPHLASVLVEHGEADSISDAFARFIGSDQPAYVATEKVAVGEVIETVHDAGGIASLAHPGRSLERENAEEQVERLVELGLDAIEVPYTYDRMEVGRYAFTAEYAAELAARFDLPVTGGSDCHGSRSDKYFLGDVRLPYRHVRRLKELAGV